MLSAGLILYSDEYEQLQMRLMRTGDDRPHMHDGAQVTLLGQRALILRQIRGQGRAWAQDACQMNAVLIATHQPVAPMRCLLGSFAIIEVADGDRIVAVATMVEADTMTRRVQTTSPPSAQPLGQPAGGVHYPPSPS